MAKREPVTEIALQAYRNGVVDDGDALADVHQTDLGNAKRLVRRFGADLRYCHPWGKYLVWDGRRWRPEDDGSVMGRAKRVVLQLAREATVVANDAEAKALLAFAHRSESASRLEAMVKLAASETGLAVLPVALDQHPWLLNVHNGTINLRTGALLPHDRDQLLTRLAPVDYDDAADCPRWKTFLERILPDPEVRLYLQCAIGYALTGRVSEQCLFFLHGNGANGKSTFFNVIRGLLGDYACSAAPGLLLTRVSERHPTEYADLHGRRFVTSVETGVGSRFDETLVKQLTGGEPIRARRMHEDFWEFLPTHKLFLGANYKPQIRGNDHAIWRRIKLVPFDVTISDQERNVALEDELHAEWPGILCWAIEGCLHWQHHGFSEPRVVASATADYRAESDVVGPFVVDQCELSASFEIPTFQLRAAYEAWCSRTGEHPLGPRAFAQQMAYLDCKPAPDPKRFAGALLRYWTGLRLRASNQDFEP